MRTNWTVRAIRFVSLAVALLVAPAVAIAQVHQTLDYPNATATLANDINDAGDVVGTFYANGAPHGFLYAAGAYSEINYPGADWTQVTGIGGQGDVVGYYGYNTESLFHGFKRTPEGQFASIDHGGHWNTMPQDVNSAAVIVGCIHNEGAMFGWVLRDDGFSSHTAGEGWYSSSMYTGINDTGTLVGWYWDTSGVRSFVLRDGGDRTEFDFPGGSNTQAWDVNQHGCIVGWYGPAAASRGFLRHAGGSFRQIQVPDAQWTRALGFNAAHDVVGAYNDGSRTHGFLMHSVY